MIKTHVKLEDQQRIGDMVIWSFFFHVQIAKSPKKYFAG